MNSVLLDTNAYTGLMNGNKDVLEYMANADTIYISTVMLGELYAGFYGGSKFEWNSNILLNFLEKETIIVGLAPCTNEKGEEIKWLIINLICIARVFRNTLTSLRN